MRIKFIPISRLYVGLDIDMHWLGGGAQNFCICDVDKLKEDMSKDTKANISKSVIFYPELLRVTTTQAVCLQFALFLFPTILRSSVGFLKTRDTYMVNVNVFNLTATFFGLFFSSSLRMSF